MDKVMQNEILTQDELKEMNIISNSEISKEEFENAKIILQNIHKKTKEGVDKGKGPFYAEIYDEDGNFVVGSSNSVIEDNCSICHAEVNTLKKAHEFYNEYNLAPKNLSLYINAEPCIMCVGAIMWSGVKKVFYSVPSSEVEKITGFDEGFKPDWQNEFRERGIIVYGGIEKELGETVLEYYVNSGKEVYKPTR